MTSSSPKATHDDANLVLKLYEMRREDRMREARRWFAASFKVKNLGEFQTLCPPGSEPNASFRMVVTYWDMVASFVTKDVLNKELFYQSGGELLFVWERLRALLPELRQANGNPIQYRNLESTSLAFIDWWNKEAPGAYDAFSARIRG
jgi:hypothetical protein